MMQELRFYSPPVCLQLRGIHTEDASCCGLAFEDARIDDESECYMVIRNIVNFYTDTDIWELDRIGGALVCYRRIPMISVNPLWWL